MNEQDTYFQREFCDNLDFSKSGVSLLFRLLAILLTVLTALCFVSALVAYRYAY